VSVAPTAAEKRAWERLAAWLKAHAPLTHATLLPGIPVEAELRAALPASVLALPDGAIRGMPAGLFRLYALAGGQLSSGAPDGARGIFDGYWMLALDGIDGLRSTLEQWAVAAKHGAPFAAPHRFPFAKDFGGAYLCLETPLGARDARVVEVGDGDDRVLARTLTAFLGRTADRLSEGQIAIDERVDERDERTVYFDATRPRAVGDAAKHSVFEELQISARVEDLSDTFGAFDEKPATLHGLRIRLALPDAKERLEIVEVTLVDPYDAKLRARTGAGSGGGKPGNYVYAWDSRPLPDRSRLKVTFARVHKVAARS